MNPATRFQPPVEDCYYENQRNFPPDELAKYYGRHVAWSRDGTAILASGASWEELFANLDLAGIDGSRVVLGYVDDPGVSYL